MVNSGSVRLIAIRGPVILMNAQKTACSNESSLSSLGVSFISSPDSERRVHEIGTNIESLLSYTREECCSNTVTLGQLVHPDDRAGLQKLLEDAAEKNAAYKAQYRLRARSGEWVQVLELGKPKRRADNTLAGFVGLLLEVERTRPALPGPKLDKLEAMAEVSNRIAHDFNNILSVLISNLDLMRRYSDPNSKSHRWLERAMKASERGEEYTQQLLSFARRQGNPGMSLNVNSCVREAAERFEQHSRPVGIQFDFSYEEHLQPVEGSPKELAGAIAQIFQNAVDALPGGGTIHVRTRTRSSRQVVIEVADSGEGMDRETLDRCFLPFFTTRKDGRHHGLGLTKAVGTARRLGGDLEVASMPGTGTTVVVTLPFGQRKNDGTGRTESTPPLRGSL